MIGTTVAHYTILAELGQGGMGKVYLAEDRQLKRKVALKFLPRELIRDEISRTRFVYEAQAASALDHPGIATIYEINENEDNPFIAMAYYSGGTLADRIRQKDLTVAEVIRIARCLSEGLQKAHEKNIVHRDIKPANIIFSEDGVPKIIDFGLAKFVGQTRLSRTGTTAGTIAYMSPEQLTGKEVDQRSDIWALGVLLYEMLAGENPFGGEYEQAIMYTVMNEDPELIGKIRPDVPVELEKIIDRALSKNPANRFQSMQEMGEALDQVSTHIQVGSSRTASAFRLARRHRKYVLRSIPVIVFLIAVIAYFTLIRDAFATPVSIVLLPLENLSRDPGQEWFTEGMTDAMINDLARIKNLRIISRSSAMRYQDSTKSSKEIAAELGVAYLIEGSVIREAEQVKINVRLVDAGKDEYMWAQGYERSFRDVLSLQGEVARAIARQIEVNLSPSEETFLTQKKSVNPEAYEAYLKGIFYLYKLTRQSLETALNYFELAARLDPDYAPAYTGIALANCVPAQMGYLSRDVSYARAQPAIEKALELDASLPEVHYMRGVLAAWYEWNWELATTSLENAIRLNPNMAEARAYYSHVLFTLKRPDEAMAQIERALQLDPFNPLYRWLYAMDLNYEHRYDDAIRELRQTLENAPDNPGALSTLRTTYHMKGMYNEAIGIWRRSYTVSNDLESLAALDSGYAEGGYQMALRRVAESKIRQSQTKFVTPWQIGTLYTRAGMPDEALKWLEKALETHDPNVPYLNIDPIFDDMREDPRFIALIKRTGL